MFAKLFQTKIRIPPLQAQFVPRPDLIQRLDEAIQWDHRLVLVSAPAGYGKTTLVNEWVSAKTEQLAVAWLSLDSDDNLPSRFWVYLIHALQTTVPDLGTSELQTLQSNFPPPFMAAMQNPGAAIDQPALDLDGLILSPLLNELAALPTDLILVLDDYQHITDMRIQRGMARFLEHLPPRVHVVIVTRVDPPLPVVYMRAHNQLTELRAADLCFTARETDAYIQQLIAGGLKPADLEKLGLQTEGWIAGLQMAGLSIRSLLTQTQNQTREERAERVSAFINAFSGKNQFIFDYLVKEVVQQQPAYVQEFLWKTSILERLSGPLCDHVVEPESIPGWPAGVTSQDILESLEGANLFLIPMDTERGWYRYHRLFADLLISRLRQAHKDWLPRLHCRASAWYEANGEINRAIYHAMESQAWDSAASLIEQYGGVLLRQGELDIVIRWMKAIPKEILTSRPKLCLQQASAYVFANQLLEVGPLLQRVEHSLAAQNEGSPPPSLREDEIQTIRAEVYFLRAYTALAEGQREQALQIALDGIQAVPETCLAERSNIFWVAGFTANILGRYAEALQYLNQALHLARRNNDAWIMMMSMADLASIHHSQGRLHQAELLYSEAIRVIESVGAKDHGYLSRIEASLAEIFREQNLLDAAEKTARSGVAKTWHWKNPNHIAWSYVHLARVLQSRGDLAGADEALQVAEREIQHASVLQGIRTYVENCRVRFWLAQGNLLPVRRWANEIHVGLARDPEMVRPSTEAGEINLMTYVRTRLAGVYLKEGTSNAHLEEVHRLLDALEANATSCGRRRTLIEIHILRALAIYQSVQNEADKKKQDELLRKILLEMDQCLSMTEDEKFLRVYLDEGDLLKNILANVYRNLADIPRKAYLRSILVAFQHVQPAGVPENQPEQALGNVEFLSEREIEIFNLLAEGLGAKEIAQKLVLSHGTIKAHIANIYRKLDIHNRAQLVAFGRIAHTGK